MSGATIRFEDGGCDVASTAWSATSGSDGGIEIHYQWGTFGIGVRNTGNTGIRIGMTMDELVSMISASSGSVVDLRPLQKRARKRGS